MSEKYLSIITNFGCHYTCPYCIVKNSNIRVPKTTEDGLQKLRETIIENNIDIVSVSGGGDPLHDFDKHIGWYKRLLTILREVNKPLEVHTSYIENDFNTESAIRMVYHLQSISQLEKVKRKHSEKVRVVFVVTDDMTEKDILKIANYVSESQNIDELSFRQLVRSDYTVSNHLQDTLRAGHKIFWYYIEQNDYNLYYAENKVYTEYRNIGKEALNDVKLWYINKPFFNGEGDGWEILPARVMGVTQKLNGNVKRIVMLGANPITDFRGIVHLTENELETELYKTYAEAEKATIEQTKQVLIKAQKDLREHFSSDEWSEENLGALTTLIRALSANAD